MDKGVDLQKEKLEIAFCAQHNNGGLTIDAWWQTNIEGFFAVGEVSASHVVYRTGGSALNSGQVGSTRAAQYIAENRMGRSEPINRFMEKIQQEIAEIIELEKSVLNKNDSNIQKYWDNATKRMSRVGAAIRSVEDINNALSEIKIELNEYSSMIKISSIKDLKKVYRLVIGLFCHIYL